MIAHRGANEMGANGVWKLATKYPSSWAAIAAIAGRPITIFGGSKQAVGGTIKYVEVEGVSHVSVVAPSFPAIIEFFDHRKHP